MKLPDKLINAINGGLIRVTTSRDAAGYVNDMDKDAIIEVSIKGVSRTVSTLREGDGSSRIVASIRSDGAEWSVDINGNDSLKFEKQSQADDCFNSVCERLLP
jgi:hypothetical protein